MKILHVIPSLDMGGAEMLVAGLLPRLNEAGYDVELLTFNNRRTELRKELEDSGITVIDTDYSGSPYSLHNYVEFRKIAGNYDIIHAHNTAAQLFTAALPRSKNRIKVTTEHCFSNRRRDKKILKPFEKWLYSRFERIVCISEPVKDALFKHLGGSDSRLEVINNGIEVSKFQHRNMSSNGLKEQLGCKFLLIQVAGFRYEKDQPTAIRALNYLPEDVHLALVGDGALRSQCEKIARENGLSDRVHFMGVRNDVPQLLSESDVAVVSSHLEGFGLAAIEGMAAGKPVVVSDIPGVSDIVSPAALMFEPRNERQLAQRVRTLCEDSEYYAEIANRCAMYALKFDISQMVQAYANLYDQLNPSK